MGSKTVFYQLESESSLDEVKDAAKRSFMFLGGTIIDIGDGFQISKGTNGVNFAFTANFDAFVNIRQSKPDRYEITANVNWNPNALFWACLIIGFFVFVTALPKLFC